MNEITGLNVPKMSLPCEILKIEGVCMQLCFHSKQEEMALITSLLFKRILDRSQCSVATER